MRGRRERALILNASVVIALIEMNLVEALTVYKQRKGVRLIVPSQVRAELDERTQGILSELVERGLLELRTPPEGVFRRLRSIHLALGDGELGVMALAKGLSSTNMRAIPILDDKRARRVAEHDLGLAPHGTVWLVKQMAKSGSLSKDKAINLIKGLRSRGFHITDDIVRAMVDQLLRL